MDAFSKRHPLVNFIFFAGAIGLGVVFQHPAYILSSVVCVTLYSMLLMGKKALLRLLQLLPLALIIAVINPVFNTKGKTVLFEILGRRYTLEALIYGAAVGGILLLMILWFYCYSAVLTGDKFTALFGNIIPSVSLVLVMVFRMVPMLFRKAGQISESRKAIGRGINKNGSLKERLKGYSSVLNALTGWALEGSITTADSMKSRGYGAAKRKSFNIYRLYVRDIILLIIMAVLIVLIIVSAVYGQARVQFTPELSLAPLSWGLGVYNVFLLIPSILHVEEGIRWRILRSAI